MKISAEHSNRFFKVFIFLCLLWFGFTRVCPYSSEYLTGIEATMLMPEWQWSNPDRYGKYFTRPCGIANHKQSTCTYMCVYTMYMKYSLNGTWRGGKCTVHCERSSLSSTLDRLIVNHFDYLWNGFCVSRNILWIHIIVQVESCLNAIDSPLCSHHGRQDARMYGHARETVEESGLSPTRLEVFQPVQLMSKLMDINKAWYRCGVDYWPGYTEARIHIPYLSPWIMFGVMYKI